MTATMSPLTNKTGVSLVKGDLVAVEVEHAAGRCSRHAPNGRPRPKYHTQWTKV